MIEEITESATSRSVHVNGMNVHYHDVGSGPPLLMLASTGVRPGTTAWLTFGKVVPYLAPHYRCIMMDLPNHGRTGPVVYHEPLHDMMARTAVALMDELGFDRFTALGNSQGGQVCTDIELLYPGRVERIICGACHISTGGDAYLLRPFPSEVTQLNAEADEDPASTDKLWRLLRGLVYDETLITDDIFEEMYKMRNSSPEFWDAIGQSPMVKKKNDAVIGTIDVPVLIIWGREDRFTTVEQGLAFLSNIRSSELVVLNKCGHWPPFERPEEYASHVLRFLGVPTSATIGV
jgi:2-hydroxy-6-oxonona-2,4-dienedioate hydrolase